MKRSMLVASALLAVAVLAALPGHAATINVSIAAFQYTPSGRVAVNPFLATPAPVVVAAGPHAAPSVARGDTILFTNRDPVPHTVTKSSGTSTWTAVNIGPLGTGSLSIPATFVVGTYEYLCSIHPGMRGAFVVT